MPAREADWVTRWRAAGYSVVLPDSFGSRGLGPQCRVADRAVTPRLRAADVARTVDWIATRPDFDGSRIALVGWSNGGSTVLNAVSAEQGLDRARVRTAVAFYPGCRPLTERAAWRPVIPTAILIGAADDWTSPEPCRVLRAREPTMIELTEYPGAFHDFDAPDRPVRVRTGVAFSASRTGVVHTGTDAAARAAAIEAVTRRLADALR